ncbi:MAG: hypothetical protein ACK40X_07090, partial [Armatimonadota bacterium]
IAGMMVYAGMRERAGVLEQAWQAAKESAHFNLLWETAKTAASLGFGQKAVEFARQIAGERAEGLPRVMDALTEKGEREAVKSLLDLCGWAVSTAVHACGCLISLYPDHAVAIANQTKAFLSV